MSADRIVLAAGDRWGTTLAGCAVRFGSGIVEELGTAAGALGSRPLVVSDPGVAAAGHLERATASLRAAGLAVATFSAVPENPDTSTAAAAAAAVAAHGADLLVALGGGSAMDTAKAANFLATNGGRMEDYRGWGRATRAMLPSIGVPTTAGTGSEAQAYALVSQADTHRKMACGDEKARFRVVLLDPELAATAPLRVRAVAGIDALAHAVESHVSRAANPPSRAFSLAAWRRLGAAYPEVVREGAPAAAAVAAMLEGSFLAGAAIDLSMLGAAHALANPLTARFGVPHGVAVGAMLPQVVRWNGEVAGAGYAELVGGAASEAGERLAERLDRWLVAAALPRTLADLGVGAEAIGELAAEAAEQWTSRFNPRPAGVAELGALYERALR